MSYGNLESYSDDVQSYSRVLHLENKTSQVIDSLSEGEIHRISFIRELARKPNVFIIDEGLDSVQLDTKIKIFTLIREVSPDCILIICTHNWSDYIPVDGVFEIQNGCVCQKLN